MLLPKDYLVISLEVNSAMSSGLALDITKVNEMETAYSELQIEIIFLFCFSKDLLNMPTEISCIYENRKF
jgi:hypothetical protein